MEILNVPRENKAEYKLKFMSVIIIKIMYILIKIGREHE